MSSYGKRYTVAGVSMFATLALMCFVDGIYVAGRTQKPALYDLLVRIALLWVGGWWLRDDSRRHGERWVYDLGFFLVLAWPFIILYYLFKTRGARALLTIGGAAVVCIGAGLVGLALGVTIA